MNGGFIALVGLLMVLILLAIRAGTDFEAVGMRFCEQFSKLVPRMLCALVAAGFIAELIPKETISGFMGPDAGLLALPVAAATGLLIPAGPVIAFAIAAIFAKAGAAPAAIITFITSWSLFAAHRILIYELPLLGGSFFRLRVTSVLVLPLFAGVLAMLAGLITSFGAPDPM
ncbi:hypothetical protein [Puniceibacterium sp. IMCC21224]|uniref:hypothetical protein n=1 Tax=Puniceibacterium sp. IMCC21224 TaxID=1618204 RepID=UPI00064DD2C5|nr:hypothetical protein [Puniceibacterium sp. IMCC21224]KMK65010.1 hypothetical protein IMCC21224_12255 [Puniceibacterium sp. IMCC21224]